MESAGADLHVQWLDQHATLVGPVLQKPGDEILEVHEGFRLALAEAGRFDSWVLAEFNMRARACERSQALV
jgi:hypothetical protein